MCGRYTLSTRGEVLADRFGLDEVPSLAPRFNIAPTQEAAVVRVDRDDRNRLGELRWGLVPHWAKEPSGGARAINARSETAATKPTFREPLRRRRCLVLADGFYEWRREAGGKVPHLIRLADGEPFAMAGLWDRWRDRDGTGETLETFTVLTTRPNRLVEPIHDRMPVLLGPGEADRWLRPREQSPGDLAPLLAPWPAEAMVAWAVGPGVNDPRRDDPRCIEPA